MTATHLHIYREPFADNESDTAAYRETIPMPSVSVRLGDLLPLVAMAQKRNFVWLKDFLDDEVRITDDLHEVLQTLRASKPGA
jgi:hypothetical protein